MTNDDTKMPEPMSKEEMIDTLKGLVFGTFDRTTAKEREALDMAIKSLEQTRWIPVSERLPEKQDCYLVTTKWKGSYSGDVYIETNMAVYREKPKEWDCADVNAWMPLPTPYKEEQDGKNNTDND